MKSTMTRTYKIIFLFTFLISIVSSYGQSTEGVVIKGTVTSKTNGETLIGVTVTEVNADNRLISGAITDINGQYVIRVKNTANKLVFSYIGFKKDTRTISGNGVINVALEEESTQLEAVTVTAKAMHTDGGISIPQREISTAVQKISTQEFEGVQVTSIDDALQGRIAGLDIVANSGDPGSGTTMRIRGASSINANTQPLIVVNGIPWETEIDSKFDFANANQEQYANMLSINPDDILDITVSKDAASTAIWGSKGANGVLSITTKKGLRGPTNLTYSYGFTRSKQPKGMTVLSGGDYTMMMKQAKFNPHQSESDADVDEYNYDPSFSEYENFNNNTDWVKAVTQTGFIHDHYLTASGGGERARYRISGGFLNQTGTVIGQELKRITSRANLDYSVSDRLKFTTEFSFSYSDNDRNWGYKTKDEFNRDVTYSILGIAYKKMPNVSIYAQDLQGNNTSEYYNILRNSQIDNNQKNLPNPVALALLATSNLRNYRISPTFRIQYDLFDPTIQTLRYSMYVSFDMDNSKSYGYLPKNATNLLYDDEFVNRSESSDNENLTVQTDNNLTWVPKFSNEKHDLLLYGSFQTRNGRSSPLGITNYAFPTSEQMDASSEAILKGLGSRSGRWRSMALMGRAHYAFNGKYILDLTFRRDGSTKFGKDSKFGNFPGISVKWIISDEPFMTSIKEWLSMLAIRPSWGISGNQPKDEYLHYSRYASYGVYTDMPAIIPSSLPLPDLRWERNTSYNIGMDIGFFNDRIILDLNSYYQKIDDMLFENISLPSISGFENRRWANVGTMENKGWEVNFYSNKLIKINDFTIDCNFNLANNKNTLIKLDELILRGYNGDYDYYNGTYLSRIQEGNSYGSIYGFKFKGVYQYNDYIAGAQESAPVARDKNGNVITDSDGDPLPIRFGYGNTNVNQGEGYTFRGGDAIYEDINYDGNIDELDIVYLGNSNPDINGGFGTTVKYKNLSVNAFFNFRTGNKIVNTARMDAENMYYDNNQSIAVNYRWRKDGDVTTMPRALYRYGYNWLGSDRYVEDGSFLRFKHLTFRYSVSPKALSKFKLKSLNLYLTINNLMTFTKYTGVDPEVGYGALGVSKDYNRTPRSKDFTFRASIGF
jgi:TonB-linked SusC/RagA family outer membrane protein